MAKTKFLIFVPNLLFLPIQLFKPGIILCFCFTNPSHSSLWKILSTLPLICPLLFVTFTTALIQILTVFYLDVREFSQ